MKRPILALAALGLVVLPSPLPAGTARYGETLCGDRRYECLEVQAGDTWESLWEDPYERDVVKRVNRMNVRLRKGTILAVPKKLKKGICEKLAPFERRTDALGEKSLLVDLSELAWAAYDPEGRLIAWGPASGGKAWCPDVRSRCLTPDGEYSALSKGGSKCKSHKFPIPRGGAPMPYCVFFRGGYALHGSPEVPGYNASHGCVRLFPEDAKWLNQEFVDLPDPETGLPGTRILIQSYSDP